MHKRSIVLAVLASFFVCGTALAAQRDITSRLGGKANDIFKITGGFLAKTLQLSGNLRVDGKIYSGSAGATDSKPIIVNDNLQVVGGVTAASATIGGLPVSTTKRYSGTIDITAAGDFQTTSITTTDCADLSKATYTKTTVYHYKTIAVPEVNVTALPDIRVFLKMGNLSTTPTYTPSQYPNNNDVWFSGTAYYLADDTVHLPYKMVTTTCGGTVATTAWPTTTSGEYQIIVQ